MFRRWFNRDSESPRRGVPTRSPGLSRRAQRQLEKLSLQDLEDIGLRRAELVAMAFGRDAGLSADF